ncbi:hypothetical protein MKX03_035601 [Papaver bracteatum]|nr:hypothetical protein MKX03_035601 [Papaver bracteatum]
MSWTNYSLTEKEKKQKICCNDKRLEAPKKISRIFQVQLMRKRHSFSFFF